MTPRAIAEKLTIGQCATLACLLEVSTPKPGNVHRGAEFEDVTFEDFVMSSVAIAPSMDRAKEVGVGQSVLDAIRATRNLVATNTNLGTVLLLAPLAAIPRARSLPDGIRDVLACLMSHDATLVYEAIRIARPGGLGKSNAMDVVGDAPDSLIAAMQLSADRDLVARQYTNNFAQVLDYVLPSIIDGLANGWKLSTSIIHTHVKLMGEFADSLIARKCGQEVAERSAIMARAVLDSGEPTSDAYHRALSGLDFWLRSDGHRRNPGTTADLMAAGLFAGLLNETIPPASHRELLN